MVSEKSDSRRTPVYSEGHPSTLFGEGGNAKSFLALHMGITVADPDSTEWLGDKVQTAPVLYFDFELDQEEQTRRAYDVAAGMGLERPPKNLLYLSAMGERTDVAFREAAKVCMEQGVKLVIVDSIGPAMQGDAEASKDVLGFFQKYINPLRSAGAAVLMVDHQSKLLKGERYGDKQAFGSVYKTNMSRSVIQVQGDWDASKTVLTATLRHTKTNFGPKLDPITAEVTFDKNRIDIERVETPLGLMVQDAPKAKDKVLEALRAGPMYPDAIAEATGQELKTVQNELSKLKKTGAVVNTGNKSGGAKEVQLNHSQPSHIYKGMGTVGRKNTPAQDVPETTTTHSTEEETQDVIKDHIPGTAAVSKLDIADHLDVEEDD